MEQKVIADAKCTKREARSLTHFKSQLKKRIFECGYNYEYFLDRNKDWLNGTIEVGQKYPVNKQQSIPGRPLKNFNECSTRTKRRRVQPLLTSAADELTFACQLKNKKEDKILKKVKSDTVVTEKMSTSDALSMFIEANITRRQWNVFHSYDKQKFPCYSTIQKEKKICYPPKESVKIDEMSAEVQLQALLNHTALRLA
ncbi:hypothetical protein DMENIID0001_041240 [Sergentomyia squamirostris]